MSQRFLTILHVAHLSFVAVVLSRAAAHLANNPNVERAVLLYFVPPLIAAFLIAVNLINATNPAVIALCQIFLSLIAVAVLLAELPQVMPNLKPQFPGLPPQQDRILVFYFFAYFLYLWILLPPYLLGTSLYQHYRKRVAGISWTTCLAGSLTWLVTIGILLAISPRIAAKLF